MAYLSEDHRPDDDDDVDDVNDSADLIANLQLEDPEFSGSSAAGSDPSGEFTDESYAFWLQQQQELENDNLSFSNGSMAQRSDSVQSHVPTVLNTTSRANIAGGVRKLARTLKENVGLPDFKGSVANLKDRMKSKIRSLLTFVFKERDPCYDEYDNICDACGDAKKVEDIGYAPCGHEYCRHCIQDLVRAALTDQSLFPPRCCRQPIPLNTIRTLLNSELVHGLINKKIEFETPNRTYCSTRICSAFIRSDNIANNVEFHQILQMVRDNGWQRCYTCSSVVELKYGCNHITCRCGAEFCYRCGLTWKSCSCEQWDEHRLLEHANVIVDRQPETPGLGLRERLDLIRRNNNITNMSVPTTELMYTIQDVPGKGKGLIAVQDIPMGTRILSEEPILRVPEDQPDSQVLRSYLRMQVDALTPDQRQAFLSMYNIHTDDSASKYLGIIRTNALPFGNDEAGIFLGACRINHACDNNAQKCWNGNIKRHTVHALRNIEKGEEITIYYLGVTNNREARQEALQRKFAFTRACRLCSLPADQSRESDKRLDKILALDRLIGRAGLMGILSNPLQNLRHVDRQVILYNEHGPVCQGLSWTQHKLQLPMGI
ncbi:hypothetical protein VE02_07062 [Pseudogymnoascus sp. 03VT05]|nr:hypothetical protein VE02_07062 [Pseudogymnoascus sp. 03VT05]